MFFLFFFFLVFIIIFLFLSTFIRIWRVFVLPSQAAFSTCACCKEDGGKERCTSLALPELGALLFLFTMPQDPTKSYI